MCKQRRSDDALETKAKTQIMVRLMNLVVTHYLTCDDFLRPDMYARARSVLIIDQRSSGSGSQAAPELSSAEYIRATNADCHCSGTSVPSEHDDSLANSLKGRQFPNRPPKGLQKPLKVRFF